MVEEITINDIRLPITPYPSFVFRSDNDYDIVRSFISHPLHNSDYVISKNLRLIGMITLRTLITQEFKNILPAESESFQALEFIEKKSFITMFTNNVDQLPVFNKQKHLLGHIDLLELLTILIEKKKRNSNKDYLTLKVRGPFSGAYA
jgi:hypothetical protein